MKHIVFDNWLLMAITSSSAIRIRALDTISLLVSGKEFIGAALSTHSPARRSRSNDAQIGTLKVDHLPGAKHLLHIHTLTTHEPTNDYARCHDSHEVIEGAKNGHKKDRTPYTHEHTSRHTSL
jgi:hypothetical protein